MIGGQHGHQLVPVGLDHHHLGMLSAFDVLDGAELLRGERFGVVQNLVADFALIEEINELGRYSHNTPPRAV